MREDFFFFERDPCMVLNRLSADLLAELLSCHKLHSILRLVLKAGNYMNAVSVHFKRCIKVSGVRLCVLYIWWGNPCREPTASGMLCLLKMSCTMEHNHTDLTCARREVTQGTRPVLGSPRCSNWPTPKPTNQAWTSYILSPWCVSSQYLLSSYL